MATIYEDDNRDLKASCPEKAGCSEGSARSDQLSDFDGSNQRFEAPNRSARSADGPTALVESKIRARHPCRNCDALLEGDALGDLPERCPCCGEWLDWWKFAGLDKEV